MENRKLRRAVIKEELLALTGDHISALALNQFLYWSERTRDFDKFIAEEKTRDPDLKLSPTHGWIYKSIEELLEELMIGVSSNTLRRRLQVMVDRGWVLERHNPVHKWDRTLQYRPDLHKIQADLHELGYTLEGYPLQLSPILHGGECNPHSGESNLHSGESIPHREESNLRGEATIPETTSKTTSEITSENKKLGANAPPQDTPPSPPPSRKLKKKPTPRAVKVFRSNAHRYPPRSWYENVVEVVGEDEEDLEFWGRVVKAYVGLGWNPTNVKNMLGFYQRREIPGNGNGRGAPKTPDQTGTSGADLWLQQSKEAGLA